MKLFRSTVILMFFIFSFLRNENAVAENFTAVDPTDKLQDITSEISLSWQSPDATDFQKFSYTKLAHSDLNLKYTSEATWLKIDIENLRSDPLTKILYFTTFLVGALELHQTDQAAVDLSGNSVPCAERSFFSRLSAFKINLAPFEKKTIYIKRTSHHSLSTRIKLADPARFLNDESNLKATLFFYAGGIFCLLLFNLFIGLYTHDKDFLYYSLFAGSVAAAVLDLHGFLDCYLFDGFRITLSQYLMCFSSMSILSSLLFANRFFNLNVYLPRSKPFFRIVGGASIFLILYGLLFHGRNNWPLVGYATDFFLVFTLISLISIASYVAYRGSHTAKFFLISWIFMLLGVGAYFGVLYGILPNVPIFYNGLLYGNLGEMLVISLGLAYKLNVLNFEKLKALEEASEKQHYHRLVKVLSHDVANASFVSSTYISRLKKRSTDPNDLVIFDKVEATLYKMNQILDSVRNEQSFKSFQQSLRLVDVNLREVILDVLHFYEDRLQSKDLRVEVDVPNDAYVLADRSALSNQVISNIISNSIKFSKPDGFISIRVAEDDKNYKLIIEDHGIGIPKDQIQKIFFSENSISTQGTHLERGSGIGCSLIREYMKQFNGGLEVESKTAQGQVSPYDYSSGTKITLIFPKV